MKNILDQLARNTNLLAEDLSAAVLAGKIPPIEEIVMALVIGAIDAFALTYGDPKSSWIDKRLVRMALAGVLLGAIAVIDGSASEGLAVPDQNISNTFDSQRDRGR